MVSLRNTLDRKVMELLCQVTYGFCSNNFQNNVEFFEFVNIFIHFYTKFLVKILTKLLIIGIHLRRIYSIG